MSDDERSSAKRQTPRILLAGYVILFIWGAIGSYADAVRPR